MAEPKWPTCLRASSCQGVQIEPGSACLAHLDPEYRARVLSGLSTAADVDVRGVEFTSELFADLVVALGGVFGYARFDGARLPGDVRFLHLEFRGDCSFAGAVFRGPA